MNKIKHPILNKVLLIIIIIVSCLAYSIFKYFSTYKSLGIGNARVDYDNYKTMIEFNLSTGPNFAFIINKDNKISNFLYLNESSIIFSDSSISNKNLSEGLEIIIDKLYSEEKLEDSSITIIDYENSKLLKTVKEKFSNKISTSSINCQIIEGKSDYITKAKSLNINSTSEKEILTMLNLYSINVVASYGENKETNEEQVIDDEQVRQYADNVYNTLEKYRTNNNVEKEEINDPALSIQLIPGSIDYYPDEESWYYIKDSKVYSYIRFSLDGVIFEYCYNGSSDEVKPGKC